jgi:hypothetical protein
VHFPLAQAVAPAYPMPPLQKVIIVSESHQKIDITAI